MRRTGRLVNLLRGAALVAVMLTAGPGAPGHAQAGEITALVPAYFYPTWWVGSAWDDLNAAATRIPIEAIMNPNSGPGDGLNLDYLVAVRSLHASGGKVIGYVSTGYGSRPAVEVIAEVSSYLEWYGVDGVFLDEMGNQFGLLDYPQLYASINGMAAARGVDLHVVGNPGIPFAQVEAYLRAADTLVIFEGPLRNADPNGTSF